MKSQLLFDGLVLWKTSYIINFFSLITFCSLIIRTQCKKLFWGPFLESPGNFSGPKSSIQIEI